MARAAEPSRDLEIRRVSDELRRNRKDLEIQFDRIAEIQAHLDETLAKLDELAMECHRLTAENRELRALIQARRAQSGRRQPNRHPTTGS